MNFLKLSCLPEYKVALFHSLQFSGKYLYRVCSVLCHYMEASFVQIMYWEKFYM